MMQVLIQTLLKQQQKTQTSDLRSSNIDNNNGPSKDLAGFIVMLFVIAGIVVILVT